MIHLSATAVRGADRAQGLTRGADAYLVEPVEPDELLATVASVLRYYRAARRAERFADRLTQADRRDRWPCRRRRPSTSSRAAHRRRRCRGLRASPPMAMVRRAEGSVQRAVAGGGRPAPVLDSCATVLADSTTTSAARRTSALRRLPRRPPSRATANDDGSDWTAVLLAARGTRAPGIVAVRAASRSAPSRSTLLAQLGQAGDARRRRAAPLHRGAQPRADPAAQLPARAGCPVVRGWRSRPGTSPRPTTPRSAATSTSSSSSTTAGCSSPSATSRGTRSTRPR